MKFAVVLGTRPEIIKLSPVLKYLEDNKLDYFVIHTNQHYAHSLDSIFFEDLNLKLPKYNLNIGSATHGKQTGQMLEKIEEIYLAEKPNLVFVQGDTNSVLSGALAAAKLNIDVAHIEAGLRSYDKEMPEETNRIVTDHISKYLFCPTKLQKKILLKEGIPEENIYVVGNTIVDAVKVNNKLAQKKSDILDKLNISSKEYLLLTMHRPSNVDEKHTLVNILNNLNRFATYANKKIIFPIHPRTKKTLEKFEISLPAGIFKIEPIGYLDMLNLMSNSDCILTDSGGIQEEACILNIPCLTLRENTERPETLAVGASFLVGNNYSKMQEAYDKFKLSKSTWKNPFGNGKTTKKIFEVVGK